MDAQIAVGVDGSSQNVGDDTRQLAQEADEAEKEMLQGIERVQTRLFEGRYHARKELKSNKDIKKEWEVRLGFLLPAKIFVLLITTICRSMRSAFATSVWSTSTATTSQPRRCLTIVPSPRFPL